MITAAFGSCPHCPSHSLLFSGKGKAHDNLYLKIQVASALIFFKSYITNFLLDGQSNSSLLTEIVMSPVAKPNGD